MFDAVHAIVGEAGWRLKSLLRARRYYDVRTVIRLYKCHILSFVEGATAAVYHAAPTVLHLLDDLQKSFLAELDLSDEQALSTHNLAPLSMRRDIAMLGLLYKVSRNTAPRPLQALFSLLPATLAEHGFLSARQSHQRQIFDPVEPSHLTIIRRSVFGLIRVWNGLSEALVEAKTVKIFQRLLQKHAKELAAASSPGWRAAFHAS